MRTLVFAILVAGCGGGNSAVDAGPDGGAPDGLLDAGAPDLGPSRGYRLAATGMQYILQPSAHFDFTPADLATDVDVISIHQDFFGLPWDAFEAGQPPPAEWVAVMDRLLGIAAGKDVFLSLQLVSGPKRQYLADKAVVQNGTLDVVRAWSPKCYDFAIAPDGAAKKMAYLRYVDWMVAKFRPRYVNVAIEVNFYQACGAAWGGVVDVEAAAYDTARSAAAKVGRADAVVFPSIQIDTLYGYNDDLCPPGMPKGPCYDVGYAKLAGLKRDRFAISTYAYGVDAVHTVDNLPPDWFTRAADRGGERAVIAETGWSSASVNGTLNNLCTTAVPSSDADAASYLDQLLTVAQARNMDLVTWWSDRDFEPSLLVSECPCKFDAGWCALIPAWRMAAGNDPALQFLAEAELKFFGAMGVRGYDGAAKGAVFDRWQKARALPVVVKP